jgi:2-methylcitrate dehydratase PrpD
MQRTASQQTRHSQSPEPSSQPLAVAIAEKICSFDGRNATELALHRARTSIIDTIGVTLAGIPERCTSVLLKTPGVADSPGCSLILGTNRRTSALDATLVNGTASHALDFDDFSGILGGHQSVPLVAALFALGEERKKSGKEVLLAYLVGVETEIRLARAATYHHYDKGWHPTSTLGTIGAAAATAYLLGLDTHKTAMALSIAPSLSSGLKANFGTPTKPLHVGQCGRNGLFAALLAEGGYDANPGVFEHHQGFFNVFNGPGRFDLDQALDDWGNPLEVEHPSIGLKQFPCCGSTHPAIMAMLTLVRDKGVSRERVRQIEVLPHTRRLRHTNTPKPETPLQAKFSVQYVVARALVDGAVRMKHFEGEAHQDTEIRRLLELTEARPHPDMADDSAEQWGAEVIVTLSDGQKVSHRIDNMVGRGGDNAMSRAELLEKFTDCAARVLPHRQIEHLFEQLETLDTVEDVNHITQLASTDNVAAVPSGSLTQEC